MPLSHLIGTGRALLKSSARRSELTPPTSIGTGLRLWGQADFGTYTLGNHLTPSVNDGDQVGGWVDRSGTSDLAQLLAGRFPILKLNQKNGLPSVRFDGSNDFIDAGGNIINGTTFTVFVVHKSTGDGMLLSSNDGSGHQIRIGQSGSAVLSMYDGTNNPISSTISPSRSNWILAEYQNGPHFWVNGVSFDNGGTIGSVKLRRIGELDNDTLALNGDIGEIVIYNTALSSGDRTAVEAYLMARWAL